MSFLVVDGNYAEHGWFARVVIPPGADFWIEGTLEDGIETAATLRPAVVILASTVRGVDAIPYVKKFQEASGGHVVLTVAQPHGKTEKRACGAGAFSCVSKNDARLLRAVIVVARLRARPPVQGVLEGASERRRPTLVAPFPHRPAPPRGPAR